MTGPISTLTSSLLLHSQIGKIQGRLNTLQTEAATGLAGSSFAELGAGAAASLELGTQKAVLQSYQTSVQTTQGRIATIGQGLVQIARVAADFKSAYIQARPYLESDPTQRSLLQDRAVEALGQIQSVLNTEFDGRHLFAGRAVSTPPSVPANSTLYGPSPLSVAGNVINTAPGTNYVANGAAVAFNAAVATLTPTAAPYDGIANTYPYVGDTAPYSNNPPSGAAVSARVAPNTDLGYTLRGDDPAIAAIQQGLYTLAATQLPAGASTATGQSFLSLLDAASVRIDQGLNAAAAAPAGVPTVAPPATGLNAVIGRLAIAEGGLQTLSKQQSSTAIAVDQQLARTQEVDPAQAITDLKNQESQLKLVYKVEAERRGLTLDKFL
ncbi:MAG: hypothetical protein HYR63_11505 [Proteobacteria bacterium]|nr:hypothetical protein [Pseudomonadota bacterium]MBI3496343.1 hypothetical protein [Pseudomonadota bacterium]